MACVRICSRAIKPLLLGLCMLMPMIACATQSSSSRVDECVVLLHGLLRTSASMKGLEWYLEHEGYHVVNVSYSSWSEPIETLSELAVSEGLDGCRQSAAKTIHFVSHSLGGILLRDYLADHDLTELGRVVMLGPPNQGSQLADQLVAQAWFPSWAPKAVRQLGTGAQSVPNKLDEVGFELGVLAGSTNWRPLLMAGVKQASDGTVLVDETKVDGMCDFLILPVTHTLMMWDVIAIQQTAHFLRHGEFDRVN